MKKIAIFASGSGSNAENIIQYFAQKPQFCVKSVFCNVPDAYVLERAKKYRIPAFVFNREEFRNPDKVFRQLQEQEISRLFMANALFYHRSLAEQNRQHPSGPSSGLWR